MRRTNLAATALLVATLSACAGADGEEPGTATITTTPTQEAPSEDAATTTPPPATTVDPVAVTTEAPDDALAVQRTVEGYIEALDQVYEGADIEGIYPWSRDAAREKWATQMLSYREQELTFTADRAVELLDPPVIDGDHADVSACLDYSQATMTNAEGEDVTPDRVADRLVHSIVLEREEQTEYGWIVVDDIPENEPCAD